MIELPDWKPIDNDAKRIVYETSSATYGRSILGVTSSGVIRLRWWRTKSYTEMSGFLGDCGNAYNPSLYTELPKPRKVIK